MEFTENCDNAEGISFFGKGYEYKLWGILSTDRLYSWYEGQTKGS